MATGKAESWFWSEIDAAQNGGAGDLAKLFKMEDVKNPGLMGDHQPSAQSTLLAREIIQNSADAAADLSRTLSGDLPPFEMKFRFESLIGDAKVALLSALSLQGHGEQWSQAEQGFPDHQKARRAIGLPNVDWLDALYDDAPLRILRIDEHGTSGMYGNFEGGTSRLYLALVALGITEKADGSGGSFGYGKAGLIAASAMRVVVAYTRFSERNDDPGITRRLLGMTYWGRHVIGEKQFTGFARFGVRDASTAWPFENEEADQIAALLGMEDRSSGGAEKYGTSFLVIEPTVQPDDLRVAIERNWWPAILGESEIRLHADIEEVSGDGSVARFTPRPKSNKDLHAFIRGYELADRAHENAKSDEFRKDLGSQWEGDSGLALGWIGLAADTTAGGWSYAHSTSGTADSVDESGSESTEISHASLVALVRGPRMVVEYLPIRTGSPFVRGTVIADPEVDDLLRQTEPKAHDAWQFRGVDEDSAEPRAIKVAETINRKIKDAVREFRRRLRPPVLNPDQIILPEFQRLFASILKGKGPGPLPPPVGERDVYISVNPKSAAFQGGKLITTELDVTIKLAESFRMPLATELSDDDEARATIQFAWQFIEGGKASAVRQPLKVNPPEGLGWLPDPASENVFVGPLGRSLVNFRVVTAPYASDWTGRIVVDCTVTAGDGKQNVGNA